MSTIELSRIGNIRGEFSAPPDKSISHRAVIFSSLAEGRSTVRNFLRAEDTLSTVAAFRSLGITIEEQPEELVIHGRGIHGLEEPENVIDCRNSGTTIRLLSGVLSGCPFLSVLTGDDSLRKRPMKRIISPLREMGAEISGRDNDRFAPIVIRGRNLRPVSYSMPVASAQVKSAILLAGLYAEGETEVIEPLLTRDHTERMLPAFGADIVSKGRSVTVRGLPNLHGTDTVVPGDFSSAAFFIAAALLLKGSEIIIRSVGVNPLRTGFIDVVREMGGMVSLENVRQFSGEPVADLYCRAADSLGAVQIGKNLIPSLIDEFPIVCVLASQAEGITEIRGAGELRVKESDRIKAMAAELRKLGVDLEEYQDGIAIKGKARLRGTEVQSYGDHRIAMSLSIAGLLADGVTRVSDASCVDISFPGFYGILERLAHHD